ncbi:hypothetical protein CZ809_03115 [Photobacterium piscicola]|uniref:Uncharacterized protein n=1 Tax=Photobacterium piscicola TaxID=1378299 RepID=A0A1T5I3C4_9GAMM|nr:hypothetical protein CZ809_03115 [Photobacterium piscicola]
MWDMSHLAVCKVISVQSYPESGFYCVKLGDIDECLFTDHVYYEKITINRYLYLRSSSD